MQSKNNMKRKGFTLVELLIVIVVIGILSAMMMLSSTEAVTSAKASNIVSNLRNLKTAAMALYVDKLDTWEGTTTMPTIEEVVAYMNSSNANTTDASGTTAGSFKGYDIVTVVPTGSSGTTAASKEWYVCYGKVGSDKKYGEVDIEARVKTKLAGRASSVGLFNSAAKTKSGEGATATANPYTNGNIVYMWVR